MTVVKRQLQPDLAHLRLVKRAEGEMPKIAGYGAVFYREDDPGTEFDLFGDGSYLERVMPGAFDRALDEDDVRSFFNHDTNIVLGRTASGTLELSVDERGLAYEIDPPQTQTARDLVTSLERGDVSGSSFMFVPRETVWRDEERDGREVTIRELHDVELWETGPVVFPAYDSADSGVRQEILAEARSALDRWKKRDRRVRECRVVVDRDDVEDLRRRVRALEGRVKLLETR